jgi:CheY-like chemotaxis protein
VNILIADDDRALIHLISSRLRSKGFQVSVAFDAMQAWMIATRTSPDAILLDIQMPGGTGLEVLKKLKNSIKTSQIPVIVLSGSIDPEAAGGVKQLGADEFLFKPVDIDRLYQTLCRLLGKEAQTPPGSG